MNGSSRTIDIAVGVLYDSGGRVLVNQRRAGTAFPGRWEFPGGKIDAGEDPDRALARELDEELGVRIETQRPLISLTHQYHDLAVRLHVNEVLAYEGVPRGREGQQLKWLAPGDLDMIDLLEANTAIVRAIILPRVCLITDTPRFGIERTLAKLAEHARSRRVLVIVREKTLEAAPLQAFVGTVLEICRPLGSSVVVHSGSDFQGYQAIDGTHIPAHALQAEGAPTDAGLTGASCHSAAEIDLANERKLDYVLLSPVSETGSHPAARPLGWLRFSELCGAASMPVYALGGMDFGDIGTAIEHGAQGVAMLGAAWS